MAVDSPPLENEAARLAAALLTDAVRRFVRMKE